MANANSPILCPYAYVTIMEKGHVFLLPLHILFHKVQVAEFHNYTPQSPQSAISSLLTFNVMDKYQQKIFWGQSINVRNYH